MKQGRDRNDRETLDLLNWKPPSVIERFDEERIKAASIRSRIAHTVAETLSECKLPRREIAEKMTAYLGEAVTKNMLDAYASEAREDHTIPYHRLIAIVHATGDIRPLQMAAELFDYLVVESRYGKLIDLGLMVDRAEKLQREKKITDQSVENLLSAVRRELPQ